MLALSPRPFSGYRDGYNNSSDVNLAHQTRYWDLYQLITQPTMHVAARILNGGSLCTNCNLLYSLKFALLKQVRAVSMNPNGTVPSHATSLRLQAGSLPSTTAFVTANLQVEVITSIRGYHRKIARSRPFRR